MNKAYRQVYKDGIGWVAIAENASCVSSSKGSGTVVEKSGVEVLKNFFDLRNSVVLNSGFLLKGLFAATLFCGVFVGDLRAEVAPDEIAKIQNNGTTVYTGNDGYRMEKVVNSNGTIGFKGKFDKSIIDRIDSNGVVEIDGRHYVIPTGTLLKDKSQLTEKDFIFFEVVKDGSGNWRGKTFGEYKAEGKTNVNINLDREVVQYDAQEKKWYMHNHAETSPLIKEGRKLYYGKKENGEFGFATWNYLEGIPLTNPKDKDGIGNPEMINGYYKIKSQTILATVEIPLGTRIGDDFMLSKPERLSLVGKDGKSTTPQKYTADDQQVKDGKRKVGDNKNGTIRLGNVARAELDDEAVNLGQLNETLKNLNTGTGKVPYVSIKSSIQGTGSNYNNDGATGDDSIAIGPNAGASAENSVAIGPNAKASEYGSVAIGADAQAINKNSVSLGAGAKTTDEDSVAIGLNAQAQGDSSYALGAWSIAAEEGATTIGTYSRANKKDSFALGVGAKANIESSVALGSDSVADTDKGIAGFDFATDKQSTETSPTWKSTAGAVSVGDKTSNTTRQITNVAAGYADTDAVNVAQLKSGIKNVVKYDSDANDKITLGGLDNTNPKVAGGVTITNLKAGTVSENSKDAINGSQLHATNDNITKNTNKITKNEGDITNINQKLGDYDKDSLFKVSNNGNNPQNIGVNGEIKFNAGENIELTVANDPKGANVEYKLMKDLTGVTSIKTNNQTYKFGFANPDEDDESVIRNKDLKTKGYITSADDKTAKVAVSGKGLKVTDDSAANPNQPTYTLSLVEKDIKDIAGTTNLTADLDKKADLNAENLSGKTGNPNNANETYTDVWKEKLGINDKADKTEITNLTTNINNKADKSDLTNLAKTDLSNITDDGKTTIKKLAKGSVEVVGDGDLVTVKNTTPNTDKDTYKVSVNADKLAKNNTFITSLGDNFAKKDASNIADNKANWETALGLSDYVKSVASTDNFIKVDATEKQNPKLSLDTEKLAGDKTFVTNIAGNNDFTTKLGNTFVTKTNLAGDLAGYTKLDGSNLTTIAKNTWRTALGVSDGDIKKVAQESVNVKAETGSKITVADKGIVDGKQTFEVGVDLTGLNGTAYTFAAGENLTVEDKSGKVKYSLNKDLKNITSIENGGKTYTFGDTNLVDTSVITNKDLTEKGYVTADTQKTTSVSTDANSGIKVVDNTTGNNTDYKLSLDETKVKEIAGTTTLTADLAKKADKNAENLGNDDVASWQTKLGIDNKADKTEITNLTTKINNGNFTSLKVSANGKTSYEIKANENIDFTGANGINVSYDENKNKFTFSANSSVIGGALSNQYAMLDGSNLQAAQGFKQGVWREALGLTNDNIANIFEPGKDISITKNSNNNKYTIAYTGKGTGTGTGGITENEVRTIIKKYIGGDNIDSSTGSTDNIVTHNVSKQETTNNKNIIAAINKINQEGIGFVHVNGGELTIKNGISENDSQANGDNSIAIGPKSQTNANAKNAIAIGTESQANGENSIAIGVGNVVTGNNSGAFGDPSIINKDNSYSVGNNNKINSENTFVLGNNVEVGAGMEDAVVLGSNSKADEATKELRATVDGSTITYDGFAGQANGKGMILSVGAKNAERQIKNVAAGKISKDSTDAVNGSQLYATNKIIGNVADSVANVIGGDAKVNKDGKISASDIGGTGQKTINDAIRSINNNNRSGNKYIAINVPTKESVVPSVSEGSNSIAIGAGSSDDKRKNVVSVGNAKTGLNRTITNVAPGKYGTDAVNMNQLYGVAGGLSKQINDVKKKSNAGIAGAVALGMLPQSNIPGDALVSIGTGYHDSESAVALGISKTSDNARWIFKGGVSYDSQDEVTAGASVGFHF